MVPVTTKPYLNSVNFTILQQGVPVFFLSIKEKTNRHITSCLRDFSTYKLQCILVSEAWITDPASLRFGDNPVKLCLRDQFLLRFKLHFVRFQRESLIRLTNITALRLKYLSLINKGGI